MEAQPQNQGSWRKVEEREKEEDEQRVFLEFEYPSPEAQLIPTLVTLPFCHSPPCNSSDHYDYDSDSDSDSDSDANLVSRSTLKRKCRMFNVDCWPSCTKKNVRELKRKPGSASESAQMNSSTPANPVGHEQNPELLQALSYGLSSAILDGTCIILSMKVIYKEDVIRFDLSSTSGFTQLKEEVGKRLNLDSSSFKIKYHDDDDDLVLITCDSDLQYFLCNSELSKSKTVKLLIYDSM